ncbi:MAG: hypothetical protein JWO07_496 [Candidatus Saccharibacteria bacterium]|nr:hypothetical protein [Candidatus Saccharibacteria bacterium]
MPLTHATISTPTYRQLNLSGGLFIVVRDAKPGNLFGDVIDFRRSSPEIRRFCYKDTLHYLNIEDGVGRDYHANIRAAVLPKSRGARVTPHDIVMRWIKGDWYLRDTQVRGVLQIDYRFIADVAGIRESHSVEMKVPHTFGFIQSHAEWQPRYKRRTAKR